MSIKKALKRLLYTGLISFIGIVCLLSLFVATTPGLYLALKLSRLYMPGALSVHHIKGRVYDEFTIEKLVYKLDDKEITFNNLKINWQFLSLLHKQLPIHQFSADSIQISGTSPFQTLNNVQAKGAISKQSIELSSFEFDYLLIKARGNIKVSGSYPHLLDGKVDLLSKNTKYQSVAGRINLGGSLDNIRWSGHFTGPGKVSFNGYFERLKNFKQVIKWNDFFLATKNITPLNSPNGRVEISGTFPEILIKLKSKLKLNTEQNWQLTSTIKGSAPWKWSFDASLLQPLESSKQEGIYTNFSLKGNIQDVNKGDFTLKIDPGHYQSAAEKHIPFAGTVIQATLNSKELSGRGQFALDSSQQVNLSFSLPNFKLTNDLSDQSLSAQASVRFKSIEFVKQLSPYIQTVKGKLFAKLSIRGKLTKPELEGSLALTNAAMDINALGLNLNPIDISCKSKNGKWNVSGAISSNGRKLAINGQGILNNDLQGELSVQGDHVVLANTKEYQIQVSPNLKMTLKPDSVDVKGHILVPEAHISPQSFTNSLSASEDIVFIKKDEAPPVTPLNTSMNIQIDMGDNVELTFKGLHALLAGSVLLNQFPQGPVTAKGELTVTKGEYKAYGQDLNIDQGQLIFTGGRVDNPGISLRASKQINNQFSSISKTTGFFDLSNETNNNLGDKITAGVEVTGRLQAPKILLFSNPPTLSQADILSMLVLGRPASQANKAGGQLLLTAISSMNLGGGTNGAQLVEQLKQKLGFDINVQSTSNYNQATKQMTDSTGVVVGKSLSERVYVSYNVGLSQADPNVLTLKYIINKFLSIQITSSDSGNGADVVYTSAK